MDSGQGALNSVLWLIFLCEESSDEFSAYIVLTMLLMVNQSMSSSRSLHIIVLLQNGSKSEVKVTLWCQKLYFTLTLWRTLL